MRTTSSRNRIAITWILLMATGAGVSLSAGAPSRFVSRGVGGGGALFAPQFSPHDPNMLFVACDMSELFRTTNGAARWELIDFREIQGGRSCAAQFTSDPLVVYALDNTSINGGDTRRPSRSLDGGVTWTPLAADPASMGAYSLYTDPDRTNRVLVSDYSTIYFSTNAGQSFAPKFSFGAGGNGCFIAGVFFEGLNIYVGTTAGLLVSTNNGATFALSSEGGIPGAEEMVSFTGARQNGTTRLFCVTVGKGFLYPGILIEETYAGSAYRGIYSLDRGQSNWVARTNGIASGHLPLFIGMARSNIATVFLAGQRPDEYPVVYRTLNAGTNWQLALSVTNNQNVQTGWCGWQGDRDYTYDAHYVGFTVSASDPNYAALTGYGFIHITTNGGAGWKAAYLRPEDINPAGAPTPKGKAYRSSGLENTTCWWLTWADSNNVIASFSDIRGVRSTDGGMTWSFNYTGHNYNSMYQALRHPNGTLYAAVASVHDLYQSTYLQDSRIDNGTGEVLFSTNNGAVWQRLRNFTNAVFSLALDSNNANRLFAAVVHSTRGGFYVSSNINLGAGSTWTKLAAPPRTEGHPFQLHTLNDGTLVCTYSGRRTAGGVFTASSGVFVSTNSGASWLDRSHTNMHYWTKDIVIDPYDPGQSNWYVGVFSGWGGPPNNKGGLYRTMDRGLTWTRLTNMHRITSCAFNPVNSNELFFTTEMEGLWHSTNIRSANPVFTQVASYPFRQPERVFFNPYDHNEIWVTSFGHGLRMGRIKPREPVIEEVAAGADGEVVIRWSGDEDQVYSVERATNPTGMFFVVASNLPGRSSFSYTDAVSAAGAVIYRLQTK